MLKVSNMKRLLLIICIFSFLFISCEESKLKEEAYKIERSELDNSLGFDWFRQNYNDYTPNPNSISVISSEYNSDYKFVIFVKPTCSCQGTQFDFPHLVKTFDNSNVPTSSYEIWSCAKESYEHPYMAQLKIMDLPACFIFKNGVPVYSVLDTFNLRNLSDTVMVEDIIMEAISK